MSKPLPPRASNNLVLKQIASKSPVVAPRVIALRNAYLQYHHQQGNPSNLIPIGLSKNESDVIYEIYKGETKKYEVNWIGKYRSAPEQTYCPLCGAPNPSQLEHYLPRAHYPEFTVLSWNLVPTCAVCNPKRGHHAHSPGVTKPLVHPYYERKLLIQPLFNVRIIRPFSAVSFIPVTCPGPFSPSIIERLEHQITHCFDNENFNRWLANKLWPEKHAELSGLSTAQAMGKIAQKVKISRKTTGMNSWDTMFFRALLADSEAVRWLCETPCLI